MGAPENVMGSVFIFVSARTWWTFCKLEFDPAPSLQLENRSYGTVAMPKLYRFTFICPNRVGTKQQTLGVLWTPSSQPPDYGITTISTSPWAPVQLQIHTTWMSISRPPQGSRQRNTTCLFRGLQGNHHRFHITPWSLFEAVTLSKGLSNFGVRTLALPNDLYNIR